MHSKQSAQRQNERSRHHHCGCEVNVAFKLAHRHGEGSLYHINCDQGAAQHTIQEEVPKELVVACANAVAHPGTVVVHSHYTSLANAAVVGTGRAERFAFKAVAPFCQTHAVRVKFLIYSFFDRVPLVVRHFQDRLLKLALGHSRSDCTELGAF